MAKSIDLSGLTNAVYGLDYEDRKLPNIRKLIAKSMQASLQKLGSVDTSLGGRCPDVLQLRKKAKAAFESGQLQVNITLNDFVCFAVIKALQKFPNVNSHFLRQQHSIFQENSPWFGGRYRSGINGCRVVRNADDLSIIGLASQLREVAAACRKGKCESRDSFAGGRYVYRIQLGKLWR